MHVLISEIITFCVMTLCVRKVITICVERLLHFALKILLHFASMLLHFALVLHFAAILITFCVNITFCGDYYILRRNSNPLLCSFSLQLIFFSEQPFYGNYSTLHSHTNTVISHTFAYSSRWRRKP